MYGPNKAWTDAIRLFKDGLLASTNDSTDPAAVDADRYFPAINDIRLPFANPPPPRDHVLKPIRRFYSENFDNTLLSSRRTVRRRSLELQTLINPLPHGDANRHTIFKRKN